MGVKRRMSQIDTEHSIDDLRLFGGTWLRQLDGNNDGDRKIQHLLIDC